MALIIDIQKSSKERHCIHKPTRCLASTFVDGENHYLQLDTYGSEEREFPDKISQSIQLDENSARQLKAFIEKAFPSL
jgi:hypothetical protein